MRNILLAALVFLVVAALFAAQFVQATRNTDNRVPEALRDLPGFRSSRPQGPPSVIPTPSPTPLPTPTSPQPGMWATYDSDIGDARSLALSDDELWVATWGRGVASLNIADGTQVRYTTADGLGSNNVWSVAIDSEGNKWFGTDKGASKFDGVNWTTYDSSNSELPSYNVFAIAIDATGNLWFGTDRRVVMFDGKSWTPYDPGWLAAIWVIASDSEGNLWFGTRGVVRFDGRSWTRWNPGAPHEGPPYTLPRSVTAIAIDSQGNKWFSIHYDGVARFDGTAWTYYTPSNSGLVHREVNDIAVDAQDILWIATGGGVSRFDGTTWTAYTTSNSGLASNIVHAVIVDRYGNLWFGTDKGVSKFRP